MRLNTGDFLWILREIFKNSFFIIIIIIIIIIIVIINFFFVDVEIVTVPIN